MTIKRSLILLASFLVTLAMIIRGGALSVQAQGEIQFSEPEVINQFPDQLTIRTSASSPDQQIVGAEFAYSNATLYSPESFTREEVEITPGTQVDLAYSLDTRDMTTPPMMGFLYRWELELADGSKYTSETYSIQYGDNRYDWQVLQNDLVAVWWHDKPVDFGQAVFDIATQAIQQQEKLYQTELSNQIQVVINNSTDEFASWHSIAHDWVGGETFINYGITVQIVASSDPTNSWLYGVIPHEISHIFFNQVTYNPTVSIPVWLNEGVAQYNELVSHDSTLQQLRTTARAGDLVPLYKLARGFGAYNTDRIYLSYAESLSAVTYLVDTYGAEGLSALLEAYQSGQNTEKAFQQALGLSATQFELDWAASLGAVDYQISTPPPMPTFRPSPTPGTGSYIGPTPTPQGTPEAAPEKAEKPRLVCSSLAGLLGFGLVLGWVKTQNSGPTKGS